MEICALVFPVRGESIFLVLRTSGRGAGFYGGYGGRMEPEDGGNIVKTATRRFYEESGARPMSIEKVAVVRLFEAGRVFCERHIFFSRSWRGELSGEAIKFSLPRPPYEKMMPGDREWFSLIVSGQKFRASLHYVQGKKDVERFSVDGPL